MHRRHNCIKDSGPGERAREEVTHVALSPQICKAETAAVHYCFSPSSCNPSRTRVMWTPECSAVKSQTCTHQRTSAHLQLNSSTPLFYSISPITHLQLALAVSVRFKLHEREEVCVCLSCPMLINTSSAEESVGLFFFRSKCNDIIHLFWSLILCRKS